MILRSIARRRFWQKEHLHLFEHSEPSLLLMVAILGCRSIPDHVTRGLDAYLEHVGKQNPF
jgi:hypothetical protein